METGPGMDFTPLAPCRVVAVPYNAEKILVVDPTSREAFAIDLPSGISEHREKFHSSCSVNGRVVAVPWNAEKILVVDLNMSQLPAPQPRLAHDTEVS